MIRTAFILSALAAAPMSAAAAQQTISGTRLDVVATGEVTRGPDIVRISTGVVTTAPTASAAIAQNGQQMASVRAALKRAGIEDRDIQTSSINLHPDYRHDNAGRAPVLIGYRASNEVSVRFRDIANTGKIIDALVAQGANQINGPSLSIEKPEAALDEARAAALQKARARAEMYARALGKRVGRIVSVSEAGGQFRPMPMMRESADAIQVTGSRIDPGEQMLSVSLSVTFELE